MTGLETQCEPPVQTHQVTQLGVLFLLTAHHPPDQLHRTFHVRVGQRSLYLCTRCLGQWLGFLLSIAWALVLMNGESSPVVDLLILALLPLPVALDWSTQTLGYRESSNLVRIITGFLYGVALGLFAAHLFHRNWLMVGSGALVFLVYFLVFCFVISRPGIAAAYLAPYEQFIAKRFRRPRD
jgi:uncharacterized membrane protein